MAPFELTCCYLLAQILFGTMGRMGRPPPPSPQDRDNSSIGAPRICVQYTPETLSEQPGSSLAGLHEQYEVGGQVKLC